MKTIKTTGCSLIDDYIELVRSGGVRVNRWIPLALKLVDHVLDDPDVYIDTKKAKRAVEMMERYFYPLYPWEKYVVGLIHVYNRSDNTIVFNRFDLVTGRGNGKNGFISALTWYLTTDDHGIENYDVDIIANSFEQADASPKDIRDMFKNNADKMDRHFDWTMKVITNKKTGSEIKANTSNGTTKYGKRSGCLVFDEFFAYLNYDQIKVFLGGLGKVPHPRQFWISTNGDVRGAVFDEQIEIDKAILNGDRAFTGRLPLLYMLEDEKQARDPENWVMANPSLPYKPDLQQIMNEQWVDAQDQPEIMQEFLSVRMNLTAENKDLIVTSWENIKKASRSLTEPEPKQKGVFGIDFSKLNDFTSCGVLYEDKDETFNWRKMATWVCKASADLRRIKVPLEEWVQNGFLRWTEPPEINPEQVGAQLDEAMKIFNIVAVSIDSYRYTLMSRMLEARGFTFKQGNLYLTKGASIVKATPVIASAFANGKIAFGDDPEMRWSVNNTKQISRDFDKALGNYTYGKIEPKSRKNDSFSAFVQAFACYLDKVQVKKEPGDLKKLAKLPTFAW